MELSDLRPGQKIRVTYEGTVQDDSFCSGSELAVKSSEHLETGYHYHRWDEAKVELVEPDYVNGAMYRAADGEHWEFDRNYLNSGQVWFSPGDMTVYKFDVPERPLVRLVPEASDG